MPKTLCTRIRLTFLSLVARGGRKEGARPTDAAPIEGKYNSNYLETVLECFAYSPRGDDYVRGRRTTVTCAFSVVSAIALSTLKRGDCDRLVLPTSIRTPPCMGCGELTVSNFSRRSSTSKYTNSSGTSSLYEYSTLQAIAHRKSSENLSALAFVQCTVSCCASDARAFFSSGGSVIGGHSPSSLSTRS
jgi:hypothetical protein